MESYRDAFLCLVLPPSPRSRDSARASNPSDPSMPERCPPTGYTHVLPSSPCGRARLNRKPQDRSEGQEVSEYPSTPPDGCTGSVDDQEGNPCRYRSAHWIER